jgi:hypothetical protein
MTDSKNLKNPHGLNRIVLENAKNDPKIKAEIRAIMNGENNIHDVSRRLSSHFSAGSRVELMRMDDPQSPPIGTKGTVVDVDALGSIFVNWDNGSSLSVIYGVDECRKIAD